MRFRDGATSAIAARSVGGKAARRGAGFSLVERLVGLAVSLIGTLAMLTVFAQFEVQKRRTTAGDDAQENGSFAAYELERVLRTRFGIDDAVCTVRAASTVSGASSRRPSTSPTVAA